MQTVKEKTRIYTGLAYTREMPTAGPENSKLESFGK
jgi:hypothetical protein